MGSKDVLVKHEVESFKKDLIIIMVLLNYSTHFFMAPVGYVFQRMRKISRWSKMGMKDFETACNEISGQKYGHWQIEVKENGYIYIT